MYGPGTFSERLATAKLRWLPFIGPEAPAIWTFIAIGLWVTVQAAVISIALSLVFGLVLAMGRLMRHSMLAPAIPGWVRRMISAPVTILVQTIRSLPLYLVVLYTYLAAPKLGLNLKPLASGVVALTAYTSCVLAEIWRSGMQSIERGQLEAAASLGLPWRTSMRRIVLPQVVRRMTPAVVSQLITLIKDTSLLQKVAVLELLRRVLLLSERYYNPIESFIVAGALYFVINLTLSLATQRLERRPDTIPVPVWTQR